MATTLFSKAQPLRSVAHIPRSLVRTLPQTTINRRLASTAVCQQHVLPSQLCSAFRNPERRIGSALNVLSIRRASSKAAPAAGAPQNPESEILTWNRFFDLRKRRRYLNLGASVTTAATVMIIGGPLLAQQDIDTWGAQTFGLDPMIVLGISTFAVAAVGWLCGPFFGSSIFGLWAGRRGWNQLIAQKEKSFYARIKRYRADPSSSSPQNPIPDYYGEKISSVKDYRRWLKDQRAFNLKKTKNMI